MAKRNTFSEDEIYDEKFDINQVAPVSLCETLSHPDCADCHIDAEFLRTFDVDSDIFYESDGRLYSDGNGWNEADFRLRCGNPSDNGVRHDQLKTETPLYEPYRAEYRA